MEFTGFVKKILPLQQGVSSKGTEWRRVDAVIEETGVQYPQSIVVTQMGDTIDQQRLIEGRRVKVYFSIKVNEYQGKYFNSTNCWKVENLDTVQQTYTPPPQPIYSNQPTGFTSHTDKADDLPF